MRTETKVLAFVGFAIGFISASLGWIWVLQNVRIKHRAEAIEHSAAEYVCDPATGATEFRWKEGR